MFPCVQVVLAKYYIDVLSIGKDSTDGKKLLNYRAPTHAKHVSTTFNSSIIKLHNLLERDVNCQIFDRDRSQVYS